MLLELLDYIVYGVGSIAKYHSFKLCQRRKLLKHSSEKVIIIGASSGIGRDLVPKLANFVSVHFQTLDTLILNAGAISVLKFSELVTGEMNGVSTLSDRLSSVQDIMSINYTSFVNITALLLKYLEKSIAGNIVVISSAAGVVGTPTRSLYSASKHALHGFYNSFRMELEAVASRVHIVIICPGSVDTKLRLSSIDGLRMNVSPESVAGVESGKLSSQEVAERIISASDASEELVFIPSFYRHTVWLAHFFPSIVSRLARKKYGL
ncbi:hypothetical protein L0F63_004407 [Massospora cicadina]|nr:hypothetical protein L0F63_004407 [Massospora cicadina]